MTLVKFKAIPPTTKLYLEKLDGATGTPDVNGYTATGLASFVFSANVSGVSGPVVATAKDSAGAVTSRIGPFEMVDGVDEIVDSTIDNVPSAAENATATRTELATELARIDVPISDAVDSATPINISTSGSNISSC